MSKVESVHCWKCAGTGLMGKINAAGIKSMRLCRHCKGIGRWRVAVGSDDWKKGKQIGAVGLGKRINLEKNKR